MKRPVHLLPYAHWKRYACGQLQTENTSDSLATEDVTCERCRESRMFREIAKKESE